MKTIATVYGEEAKTALVRESWSEDPRIRDAVSRVMSYLPAGARLTTVAVRPPADTPSSSDDAKQIFVQTNKAIYHKGESIIVYCSSKSTSSRKRVKEPLWCQDSISTFFSVSDKARKCRDSIRYCKRDSTLKRRRSPV